MIRAHLTGERDHDEHAPLAWSAGAPLRAAQRTTALAPMINRRRSVQSPFWRSHQAFACRWWTAAPQ